MHNTYSPWSELSLQRHLVLEWVEFDDPEVLGEYEHERSTIRLDPRLCRRQMRSVLAHELRHAEYGDERTHCERTNLRQEQRADREAAWLLIDIRDLAGAMILHSGLLSAVAVELNVSNELLETRLRNLHPAERGVLARCAAELVA